METECHKFDFVGIVGIKDIFHKLGVLASSSVDFIILHSAGGLYMISSGLKFQLTFPLSITRESDEKNLAIAMGSGYTD